MKLYREIYSLEEFTPWGGGKFAWHRIKENNLSKYFIYKLSEGHRDVHISETELNDLLWFDSKYCLELVGLDEHGNPLEKK